MFKFEMTIGWLGNGSIKIETNDFDVIDTLKDFINYQEGQSWAGAWEEVDFDEEDEDEDEDEVSDDETTVAK